jgi:hypothetical protein
VEQKLLADWDESNNVKEGWNTLKTALCDGVKVELGYENRRQPDWFRESEEHLKPLFSERNWLQDLWLSTGKKIYQRKHRVARRSVRREMRAAKNTWFQCKALEAESRRHSEKLIIWKCIRDI